MNEILYLCKELISMGKKIEQESMQYLTMSDAALNCGDDGGSEYYSGKALGYRECARKIYSIVDKILDQIS